MITTRILLFKWCMLIKASHTYNYEITYFIIPGTKEYSWMQSLRGCFHDDNNHDIKIRQVFTLVKIIWTGFILEGGLLAILIDSMIFLTLFLDVIRKDAYTNSFFPRTARLRQLEFLFSRMLSSDLWSK